MKEISYKEIEELVEGGIVFCVLLSVAETAASHCI